MPEPARGMRPSDKRGFLTTVESVRGIAALYVAVAHTMIYILFIHYNAPLFDLANSREVLIRIAEGLIHGPMAVMVFFVISGLVIGRSLDGVAAGPPATQSYAIFLIRRFLRLYPAHIAALTAILVIGWLCLRGRAPVDFSAYQPADDIYFTDWLQADFNPLHLKTIIANYAMVRWSMNLVVWSLFVEICAAPLLPLFHWLSRRNSTTLDAVTTGVLLVLCVIAWGHLAVEYWFAFYLGMLVDSRGREWVAFATKRCSPGLALALSYALMAAPAILLTDRPPATSILEVAGAFSLISLVVWCDKSKLFGVLDHPLLRWNGRLSYSFYLWHYFILTMAVRGLYLAFAADRLHRHEIVVCALTAAVTIAAALALAQLSYRFVEVPFIGFGRSLAEAWRKLHGAARAGRLIELTQEQAAP